MAERIETNFTKEDVNEYVKKLQAAIGNKDKVFELLNLEHLPIFVAYLKSIGVSNELLEFAGVVEFTRFKMRDVLSNKKCTISDRGVEFEGEWNSITGKKEKSLIGIDDKGVFRLDNNSYFEFVKWRNNVFIRNDSSSRPNCYEGINAYGAAYLRCYDTGYYSVFEERTNIDGIPYYRRVSSDGIGFEDERKTIDIGQPVYNGEFENTFAENYRMYVTLFPRLKEWYEIQYGVNKNNVDEYSKNIEVAQVRDKINGLDLEFNTIKNLLYRNKLVYTTLTSKIDSLINCLKGINPEHEDGKRFVSEILSYAEKVREDNKESSLEGKEENDDSDKEEVENIDLKTLSFEELKELLDDKTKKVRSLRESNIVLERKNYNYRKAVYEIERRITECKVLLEKRDKDTNKEDDLEVAL